MPRKSYILILAIFFTLVGAYTYTILDGGDSNFAPSIDSITPSDGAIGVSIQPRCEVKISDKNADSMDVTFATNRTGSWINYQTNSSVFNGTYIWDFDLANKFEGIFYWRVYIDDGTYNHSCNMSFTVKDIMFTTNISSPCFSTNGNITGMHNFQPVHKMNISEVNVFIDGAIRKYVAYDCTHNGSKIKLWYTNNLESNWTAYSGNPIFGPEAGDHWRWPSAIYNNNTFHMILCDDGNQKLEYWTSIDAINYTHLDNVTLSVGTHWMNPFLWYNDVDDMYYLYHKKHGAPRELFGRRAKNITHLLTATDTIIIDDNNITGTVAASAIMYDYDTERYWLFTEGSFNTNWAVFVHCSLEPFGNFTSANNSMILIDDEACPIPLVGPEGEITYFFTSKQWSDDSWSSYTRILYL